MGSGRAKGQSGSLGGGGGDGNGFSNIWNNLGSDGAPLFDADTLMAGVIASVSMAPRPLAKWGWGKLLVLLRAGSTVKPRYSAPAFDKIPLTEISNFSLKKHFHSYRVFPLNCRKLFGSYT